MILKDKRLLACAKYVKGERVCDVGTDHGYLPAYLLTENICKTAIAADVNEKPLLSADRTLRENGLSDRAQTVLSDGLKSIDLTSVTDIVIAGMGGELISAILAADSCLGGINLILQPMTKAPNLRKWLCDNGFCILSERAVEEGRHIYTVINAVYDNTVHPYDNVYLQIGALDPADDTARKYIRLQAERLMRSGEALCASGHLGEGAEHISCAHKIMQKTGEKTMYKVKDILAEMDKIAPLKNIHKGDNSGLLVGDPEMEVTSVLTALDITVDVVREAAEKGANVIVAHHPVIFHPLYTLDETNPACLALKLGIACICFHSPLDMADGGINDIIYDMLKEPLSLSKPDGVVEPVHPDGRGYGMVCDTFADVTPEEMAAILKQTFGCTVVRYTKGLRTIKRIAFCSGGAGSDLPNAMALGADAYITGDVKHDQLITAKNNGISLFDCGHYHTEDNAMPYLKMRFNEDYPDLSFEIADSDRDPACYAL